MKKVLPILLTLFVAYHANAQIKILSLGESTTDFSPSYRKKLCELMTNFGSKYDMVGPKNDGSTTHDGDHAGYSGNPSDQVQAKLEGFYMNYSPDVVLIWEGTNDCGWASANGDTTNLGKLVNKVIQLYPQATVFVASIPPMSYNAYESVEHGRLAGVAQANGVTFNKNLPALVASRAKAGKKIYYVDATSLTLEDVSSDGIHPNLQGYNKTGTFFFEAMKTTVLDAVKPTVPSNLKASNVMNNTFALTWSPATDNMSIAGYNVYKNGTFYKKSLSSNLAIEGLGSGQSYVMQVEAVDPAGNTSGLSTGITVLMAGTKETVPPTVPTNLSAETISSTNFVLSWAASTDNDLVAGYEVFKNGDFIGFIGNGATKLLVSGLIPGVAYSMTVRAKDAGGNYSAKSAPFVITTLEGALKFEAEDATLLGGAAKATNHKGFSGTGFVDQLEKVGTSVSFNVGVASQGNYLVALRYANGMANARTLTLYVNDVKVKQTSLPNLASWDTWGDKSEMVSLKAGANKITYAYDAGDLGFVNLDFIDIAKSSITSVDITNSVDAFKVYPNPSNGDKLYVDFTAIPGAQLEVSLLNSRGVIVHKTQVSNLSPQTLLLPSGMAPGVYMLEALAEGKRYLKKIVIQ